MAKDLEKMEQNVKAFIERMVDKHGEFKYNENEDLMSEQGLP